MKRLVLLAGMLLVLNVQAQGVFTSGNQLFESCIEFETRPEAFKTGVCAGYVSAVADFMALKAVGILRACIPPEAVTRRQLVAVVTKYLRDHPEDLHYSANTTAMVALSRAFPCSK